MAFRFCSPAFVALLVALSACSENKTEPTPGSNPPDPPGMTDPDPEPAAASPFVVGFAVNHDGSQRVIRGWPLVVRISATFASETDKTYTLDDDTLSLRVRNEGGAVEEWRLEAPPSAETARALDTANPTLEVVRLLSAGETAKLTQGARIVELTWGPARESFAMTVEDAPRNSDEARALLQADESLHRDDVDAALEALDERLDADPTSVALLNQRAIVHERAGDAFSAFADAQAALAAFVDQFPDATEPPVTILQITGRLLPVVLGGKEAE